MLRKFSRLPSQSQSKLQPHICLSCQRRLARPINSHHTRKSFYSTTTSSPDIDADSTTRSTRPTPDDIEPTTSAASSIPKANNNDASPPQTKRKLVPLVPQAYRPWWSNQGDVVLDPNYKTYRMLEEPMGEVYGHRGGIRVKETEEIETKTFGEPSKILVLRQSRITKYAWDGNKETQSEHLKEGREPVDIDSYILERMDAERGLPSLSEVEENINSFEPKKGKGPQDWEEFNNLIQEIQESFTTPQLQHYIDNYKGRSVSGLDTTSTNLSSSSKDTDAKILRKSPWVTELFDTGEYFASDSVLHGYALASHTNKQRIIVRLLRECWKLDLPDVENSIGSVDIAIRPNHLELLMKSDLFTTLKEELLGRACEEIETFPSSGVIKITTTKTRYEPVLERIEAELQNIRTMPISLAKLMPSPTSGKPTIDKIQEWADLQFDDKTLLELSRLTDTRIARLPQVTSEAKRQIPISISCLLTPDNPWKFTRAQQARRLLLSSCNLAGRTQHVLGCRTLPEGQNGTFVEYGLDSGLSWRDKLRKWTRFSAPIGKDIDIKTPGEIFVFPDHQDDAPIDQPKAAKDLSSTEATTPPQSPIDAELPSLGTDYWSDHYTVASEAVLGAVLHTDPKSPDGMPRSPVGSPEIVRAFSPTLPTISKIIKSMKMGRENTNDSLVLRFQPNPFFVDPITKNSVGADVLSAFPTLEMTFDAVPNPDAVLASSKDLVLRSVDAVVEATMSDIMLPDQAADVRFKQKTTSRLRSRQLSMPQITEYLKFSDLQAGTRRLDLPPKLTMPIAKHLCRVPELAKLNRNPRDEIHMVEYLFVDRQFRSGLSLSYNDWRVSYTYVNGGADGKRNELTVKPIKSGSNATKQEFLNTVFELTEAFGSGGVGEVARKVEGGVEVAKLVAITEEKEGPLPGRFDYSALRTRDFVRGWFRPDEAGRREPDDGLVPEMGWEEESALKESLKKSPESEVGTVKAKSVEGESIKDENSESENGNVETAITEEDYSKTD